MLVGGARNAATCSAAFLALHAPSAGFQVVYHGRFRAASRSVASAHLAALPMMPSGA
jgi:uncharacterized protein YbbK (DUF523 family)